MRLARDEMEAALEDQAELLISARQAKDPQVLKPALAVSAYVLAAAGRAEESQRILGELFAAGPPTWSNLFESFTDGVLAAEILGRRDEARRWLGNAQNSPWFDVARALIDQEFVRAADSLDSMGAARSGALARLRAAEELVKAGRQARPMTSSSVRSVFSARWAPRVSPARERRCWPPRRDGESSAHRRDQPLAAAAQRERIDRHACGPLCGRAAATPRSSMAARTARWVGSASA
jgi:hypothetical protein